MDQKSAQISDPKLKEAYDRVMGTSLPTPPTQPSNPAPQPMAAPAHPQMSSPMLPKEPAAPSPVHTSGHTDMHTMQTAAAPSATPAAAYTSSSTSSGFVAPQEEKKSAVSGKLLIVAGIVFLLVYTLFWLKWFGIPLPFLP